LYIGDMDR